MWNLDVLFICFVFKLDKQQWPHCNAYTGFKTKGDNSFHISKPFTEILLSTGKTYLFQHSRLIYATLKRTIIKIGKSNSASMHVIHEYT